MNENQFDEFFRKKLSKYSSPVPGDMWQRIQQKRDKDRKGFFFKWLAILLLIFVTAGYFILYKNKNADNEKALSSFDKQTIEKQNSSRELSKDTKKSKPVKRNADRRRTDEASDSIKPSTFSLEPLTRTGKQSHNNHAIILSDKHGDRNHSGTQYFSPRKDSSGKYPKQKKQQARGSRMLRPVGGSANIHINNASDSSNNKYRADENIVKKDQDSSTNAHAIKVIPLPEDSFSKKAKPASENKSKKESELSSGKKWFLELYVSPGIPFNKITSGSVGTTDFIKKNFKTHVSYSLGLGIGRSIDKHLSVKAGFQYSKIIAKMIDSNGVGIAHHYMGIDAPFLIGYKIKNNDFSTTVNAGVIFNLYSWYKGNGMATYKDYAGISLYAGLNFAKQISNKIELFAEPHFRYRLSYMTRPQAPFNQKIHVAGISFGLQYNF